MPRCAGAERRTISWRKRPACFPCAVWSSLAHTRALIQQAYRGFNSAEDGDLIESYVFEINALQSRYNYLLRRVKELEAQP